MAASKDLESCLGTLALVILGLAGWFIYSNRPISLWLIAALIGWGFFVALARKAKDREEAHPSFRAKLSSAAAEDARAFFLSLSIGFALVLLAQIGLRLFGSPDDAQLAGTSEQRLWEALIALKSFGSLPVILLTVSAALLLSVALGSWRPLVAVSWARKGVSTSAAILAAALMFSFVTARVAEANFDASTSGLRAQLFAKLADVAKTQRARAAEQWAFASLQRKMESDPEWSRNVRDYYTEGMERCAAYNEQLQAAWERVPVDIRLQAHKPDECDAQTIAKALSDRLFAVPPPSTGPAADATLMLSDSEAISDPSGSEIVRWVPGFASTVAAVDAPDSFLPPADREWDLHLLRPIPSLGDWRALLRKADEASRNAQAGRGAIRSALVKLVASLLDVHGLLPELPEEVSDTLRDAAISTMARESERKIKQRLQVLAEQKGDALPASAAGLLLATAFPETDASTKVLPSAEARSEEVDAIIADHTRNARIVAEAIAHGPSAVVAELVREARVEIYARDHPPPPRSAPPMVRPPPEIRPEFRGVP